MKIASTVAILGVFFSAAQSQIIADIFVYDQQQLRGNSKKFQVETGVCYDMGSLRNKGRSLKFTKNTAEGYQCDFVIHQACTIGSVSDFHPYNIPKNTEVDAKVIPTEFDRKFQSFVCAPVG